MSLTFLSLNIEADLHLDSITDYLSNNKPDVVCLQEVYLVHARAWAKQFGYYLEFATNVNFTISEHIFKPLGEWGIATLTKIKPASSWMAYYTKPPLVIPHEFMKVLKHPRSLLVTTVIVDKSEYVFANTHFTWAMPKDADVAQADDFARFKDLLTRTPSLVLSGDFNASRESLVYKDLSASYISHVPQSVESTLDPELFRKKDLKLKLVVDHLFSTPDYAISNVQVLSGLSDHCGISATISKL